MSTSRTYDHLRTIEDSAGALLKEVDSAIKDLEHHHTTRDLLHRLERLRRTIHKENAVAHRVLHHLHIHVRAQSQQPIISLRERLRAYAKELHESIRTSEPKALSLAALKIKPSSEVIIYGMSGRVLYSIARTRPHAVHLFDVHPSFDARPTLQALLSLRKSLVLHTFAQIGETLEHTDLALIGCEFVTNDDYAVCLVGTRTLLTLADKQDVPTYLCIHSLDHHPHITHDRVPYAGTTLAARAAAHAPFGMIDTHDRDIIPLKKFTAIISEHGIYPYASWKKHIRSL